MIPFDIGAITGSTIVGAVTGAARTLANAVDFSALLGQPKSPADSTTENVSGSQFQGINEAHRRAAEHRTKLQDALGRLSELLASAGASSDMEVARDSTGRWRVSGDPSHRVDLEQALAQDPEWNAAWNEMLTHTRELIALGEGSSTAALQDRRLGVVDAHFETDELRLRRTGGTAHVVLG